MKQVQKDLNKACLEPFTQEGHVLTLPSASIEPVWRQFETLIPERPNTHPLRCHKLRIRDLIIFDKLIQVRVLCAPTRIISDATCSAATIRRRDERIASGIFNELVQIFLESYDRVIRLDLVDLVIDGWHGQSAVRR